MTRNESGEIEMTDGINGDLEALNEEKTKEGGARPASATARDVGSGKKTPVPAPEAPVKTTDAEGEVIGMPDMSGVVAEANRSPAERAAEITRTLRAIDGDTIVDDATGERIRLLGVDALESGQSGGGAGKARLQELLDSGSVRFDRAGKDAYGRTLARVFSDGGEDFGKILLSEGLARTHGEEEREFSGAYRDAELAARGANIGMWSPGSDASENPSAWRRGHMTDFEREKWELKRKEVNARVKKVMSPEAIKAAAEAGSASANGGETTDAEKKLDKGVAVATAVANIANVGFANELRGRDVDEIPTHELNSVLFEMKRVFGYETEDFRAAGFDNPYDAAREYVKSAMGIVRASEKRKKAFEAMTIEERQQQMNAAAYGEDAGLKKWFSSGELKAYSDSMTYRGLVESALMNGAEAKTVATAVMIALSEFQDEDLHRNRLAKMDIEQAKLCAGLAGAIRSQYDGNFFAKGMISLWNSVEYTTDNIVSVIKGDAFGVPTDERVLDVLSKQLENTLIDNTDDYLGEVATTLGTSIPVMALLALPGWGQAVGVGLYAASAYGEASKIPILEGWEDYDPVKMEAFKTTYALAAPAIEKCVIGLAMKPISGVAKASGIMSPKLAGMMSTKTLAAWLAGAQVKSAAGKIARGMCAMGSRTIVSGMGEVVEEAAEQAILAGGGMFVDPLSADGRKLYNIERFSSEVIDAAWTAIKTTPWMTLPFAGMGVAQEYYGIRSARNNLLLESMKSGKIPNILEFNQQVVNSLAAYDAKTRAEKLGGLETEEVAEFFSAEASKRAKILEGTTDKNKAKWLGELDKYLRYNEELAKASAKRVVDGARRQEAEAPKPAPDATAKPVNPTGRHREAADAELEDEADGARGTEESGGANPHRASSEGAESGRQETAEAQRTEETNPEGSESGGASHEETKNPSRRKREETEPREKGENTGVPDAGTDDVKPTPSGESVKQENAENPERSATRETEPKKKARKTPTKNTSKKRSAKKSEDVAEKKVARKKGRKAKSDSRSAVINLGTTEVVIPLTGKPDLGFETPDENPYVFSLEEIVRPLSPEIGAAFGDEAPEGVTLNPHMVDVFKGAIEESENTGVAIMDIFERVYGRKLLSAVEDPDSHKEFLADPFSWAETVVDELIGLARRSASGDEEAADALERVHLGERAYRAESARRGKPSENPALKPFVDFAKRWLKSAFGEGADIYFIEDAIEDPAHSEVVRSALAHSGGGKVNAFLVTSEGNVYVSRDANPVKVLHEVFGHATWQWMKKNDAKGYAKLRELALNAPQEIKDKVAKNYGTPDASLPKEDYDRAMDLYLDEVFAHLMEARYSGRVDSMFDTHDKKAWYARAWEIIAKAIRRVAKAVFGEDAGYSPEEFLNSLSERFFGHGCIFLGEDAKDEGLRFSKLTAYATWLIEGRGYDKEGELEGDPEAGHLYGDGDVVDEVEIFGEGTANAGPSRTRIDEEDAEPASPLEAENEEKARREIEEESGAETKGEDRRGGDAKPDAADDGVGSSTGMQNVDIESFARPSYLLRSGSDAPFDIQDTFDAFTKSVSALMNLIGLDYKMMMSPTYWELFKRNGQGTEEGAEIDSLARRKFDEILGKKKGKEREVAELIIGIAKRFSADPATSAVWVTDEAAEEMQKDVEKIRKTVEGMKDGTERKEKLLKQAEAAEYLVGMAIRNSSEFVAFKNVLGSFIAFMRPSGRKIGESDTELTAADYERFDVDDSRRSSGMARIVEMQGFDEVQDTTVHLGHFLKNFEAMKTFSARIRKRYGDHQNKYVRKFVDDAIGTMNSAYKAANEEFLLRMTESKAASLLALKDDDGGPKFTREKALAVASGTLRKKGVTLKKWAEEQIAERKARRAERARRMLKLMGDTTEHEADGKSILAMKYMSNAARVVSFLERDDFLREAKAKREASQKKGEKPDANLPKAEPVSEEMRRMVEIHVERLLSKNADMTLTDAQRTLPVEKQRMILRDIERTNKIRALYREFYEGYKAARSEGKIYPFMSEEHAELYKSWARYRSLADDLYRMPVGVSSAGGTESVGVNPMGDYRTILRAKRVQLEKAKARFEKAEKAYEAHMKTRKYRDGREIWNDIAKLKASYETPYMEKDSGGRSNRFELFDKRQAEIMKKYFGPDKIDGLFLKTRGIRDTVLRLLKDGDIERAESVANSLAEAALSSLRRASSAQIDAADKLNELSAFKFDKVSGRYVRTRKTKGLKEIELGGYEELPSGLRKALKRNGDMPGGERESHEEIVWRWMRGEGRENVSEREWIGLLSEMSEEHFNDLKRKADIMVAQVAESRALGQAALSVHAVVGEAVRAAKLSMARRKEENPGAEPDAAAAGAEGAKVIEQTMLNRPGSLENGEISGGGRVPSGNPRSGVAEVRYSKDGSGDAEGGGGRVGGVGAAERRARMMQERVIDFAVVFVMRMLKTGSMTLSDKECAARARKFDPYMGGTSLRTAVEAAKVLSQTMLEQPGVEHLRDDQLQQLALKIIQNLAGNDAAKIAEAMHDIQTDTWKSIAESYQKKIDRLVRTGRVSDYNPLSSAELRKLGILVPGEASNVYEDTGIVSEKDRLPVEAYRGMNKKVFEHIFGHMKPKRADYATDEEYQSARKKYSEDLKKASPQLLERYRDTLTWLYGKYGTDMWLRRYFGESAASAVRRLVGQMRDFADDAGEIYRYASRIETILSQAHRKVNPSTLIGAIRSMIEPFVGDVDPRRALKKRKISPRAQAFLKAVYEGMMIPDERKLSEMVKDVAAKTDEEVKNELAELRAKAFRETLKDVEKKAEEAKNQFNGANEAHGSGVKQTTENTARAMIELNRQAGYRMVMPYLSLNGNAGVIGNPLAKRDDVVKMLDKIYFAAAKVIAEGAQEVESHVKEETEAVARFVRSAEKILGRGKSGEVDKNSGKKSYMKDLMRRLGALVFDGFSLKQRLEELGRFADANGKRELFRMFDEFINTPVATAESERSRHYLKARMALNEMILKVYANGEASGIGEVATILQQLNTQIDELKEFSASGKTALTRAQLMAQVAMLSQEDVQAPIVELERRIREKTLVENDEDLTDEQRAAGVEAMTDEQKVMVRRLRALPKMIDALDRISEGKDKAMIEELMKYYESIAPELDNVAVKITGVPISIGSPMYFPVRRSGEYKTRGVDKSSRVIGAVPDYLSPRENTTTDINEEADIFSIFSEQAENNAHFLAFGRLHYRITTLFDNSNWSRLTNRLLGKDGATMLTSHVQDICSPKLLFVDNAGGNSFWALARKWVSVALLGGNILVAAKQTTSMSAFAHEVGWHRFLEGAMRNPFSKEMQEVRKELFGSPEAKMRWGDTWIAIQNDLMQRPGKSAKVAKAFTYYMSLQRWGDFVPSWIAAPGIYLANVKTLMSRVNPETGKTFTEEEAKTRAREMVFDMIEKTQQTSRVSNMGHSQRRGQAMAQLWTQFMSSTMLFFSSEIRAWRDVAANPKDSDNWKRLGGMLLSNHILMPTLLKTLEVIANWAIGGDEPDEEDLKQWIAMIASGPLSGLVLLGNILSGDEKYGNVTAPTVSFFGRVRERSKNLAADTVTLEGEKAAGDVHKLLRTLIPFYRDTSKAVDHYLLSDKD